jgi:transposase-like protein
MPNKLTTTYLARLRGRHWTTQDARAVLAAQAQSGESLSAFARRHGLTPQRLCWWRKRLAEWDAAEENRRPLLVPVVSPAPAPDAAAPSSPQVRLRCGDVQIDLPDAAAVPAAWLAALVRELGARR